MKRLLTVEVAEVLRCTTEHAATLCRTGRIPAMFDGRKWTVDERDVAAYVSANTRQAVAPTRRRRRRAS